MALVTALFAKKIFKY